jgi:hypothetical protein
MNKEKTEIVVLMDASGSMHSIREDAVGGLNAFVEDQKKESGEANLTVTFFDSNRYAKWQDGIDLQSCPVLGEEYQPGASTPLLDATGRTIEELGARLSGLDDAERPGRVMVIILTDGHENSSRHFTKEQVKGLIRQQEATYKWEFVYLGANVDAFAEGAEMGFQMDHIAGFTSSKRGIRAAFDAVSASAKQYRRRGVVEDLGRQIGEDE